MPAGLSARPASSPASTVVDLLAELVAGQRRIIELLERRDRDRVGHPVSALRCADLERLGKLLPVVAKVTVLDAKVDALLSRLAPGPRDRGDEHLVSIIAAGSRGFTFTAAALWQHRAVDGALAAALANADLESP